MTFDMPTVGTWAERGGWVVNALGRDVGLTQEQAAGIVGNLGYESIRFTAYHEIGLPLDKGGVGWAQWTGPRRVAFESWCAARDMDPSADAANYGFLVEELTGSYKGFTTKLRQRFTIEECCRLAHQLYETPSDVLDGSYRSQPDRLLLAKQALAGARAAAPSPAAASDKQRLAEIAAELAAISARMA